MKLAFPSRKSKCYQKVQLFKLAEEKVSAGLSKGLKETKTGKGLNRPNCHDSLPK